MVYPVAEPEQSLIRRLERAVDNHDLEAVVDCFDEGYSNETPVHPGRSFSGREQVRTNWARIFEGIPDITARVLRTAEDDDTIWSEWEMSGTRLDGQEHLMRGVIIFGVSHGRFSWARFYLESVDPGEDGIDRAISQVVNVQTNR